jgi:hypothetical protein
MPDGEFHISDPARPAVPVVRLATEADEAAVFELLLALYDDNAFGAHPVNPDKVLAMIRRGTRKEGAFIGVIDGPDGRIAASAALDMTPYWYSDDWFLNEQWFFVRPECRSAHLERALFRWAEQIRRLMEGAGGRWEIVMGFWTPVRLAAKIRLWSRYARQVGAVFIMDGDR